MVHKKYHWHNEKQLLCRFLHFKKWFYEFMWLSDNIWNCLYLCADGNYLNAFIMDFFKIVVLSFTKCVYIITLLTKFDFFVLALTFFRLCWFMIVYVTKVFWWICVKQITCMLAFVMSWDEAFHWYRLFCFPSCLGNEMCKIIWQLVLILSYMWL